MPRYRQFSRYGGLSARIRPAGAVIGPGGDGSDYSRTATPARAIASFTSRTVNVPK